MQVIKRDGKEAQFESEKIVGAVQRALFETGELPEKNIETQSEIIADIVCFKLDLIGIQNPHVENIQDLVEKTLMEMSLPKTAKAYILYRAEHSKARDLLMGKFEQITLKGKESEVSKGSSGNANVDSDTAMGKMLQFGSESSKAYTLENLISPEFAKAHIDGDIHIHDLDFYAMKTLTCCQIDLKKLYANGFSTGHGYLREPNSIGSYAALAAIAIQANQNEQHV